MKSWHPFKNVHIGVWLRQAHMGPGSHVGVKFANLTQHGKELPRYEVEKLELEIIGSSNDTKHFENPALPPSFENFKKEPTISGGADGAFDPELKQPNVDPPVAQ